MPFVMPEIILQRVIQTGIDNLRADDAALNDIFASFASEELAPDYGVDYIDKIRKWFKETKIPVVQAWSFNPQRIPCISIHLATELEDESKAAAGDHYGTTDDAEIGVGVFSVMVDIGLHANRSGDQVLWLYYIVSYILFKEKLRAERMGLQIHTWNASDYSKDAQYVTETIFSRWLRFRTTTENFFVQEKLDVTPDKIDDDITLSRVGDDDDDEDLTI